MGTVAAATVLAACSTVASVIQNTFPYNSTFVITQNSPANTELAAVGSGGSITQLTGASANVKDIRPTTATLTITSGGYGAGIFKNVRVYITSGGQELLVASRDNIADNLSNTLSLDVNGSVALDEVMRNGTNVHQRIVYTLKQSPTSDLNVRSSVSFNSVPVTK